MEAATNKHPPIPAIILSLINNRWRLLNTK